MQFTLDSVTQFIESLKEKNKGKKVSSVPVLIDNLNDISKAENKYYFGILTIGSNVSEAILKDENDLEIITIIANGQIVDYFSYVSFVDNVPAELANPLGHFRGFEIIIT